jgi:hypothetical protein
MTLMGTMQHPNDDYLQYFDRILMLIDGRIGYQGPRAEVEPFLESHGSEFSTLATVLFLSTLATVLFLFLFFLVSSFSCMAWHGQ